MNPGAARHERTVLFLAFHFAPIGGAGVQRSLAFARHLPRFGFRPLVITGPVRNTVWPPQDPSLLREIPPDLVVYRLGEQLADPADDKALPWPRRAWNRLRSRPSAFSRQWVEGCVELGLRAAAEHEVDLICASMSPFESTQAAQCLSDALKVPWVADLRDPWALDEMRVYPTRWHRLAEERRMRSALSGASLVVMNTPEAASTLCEAFPEFANKRVAVITNGFEPSDFSGPPSPREHEAFRIVHTGHLHAALGRKHARTRWLRRLLGGERVNVDVSTRSHVYILRALERWQQEAPEIHGRVELVLAGAASAEDRRIAETSRARDLIRLQGYLDHTSSVRLLLSADLLFLPMQRLPDGVRARIVPGKTYEYLAARRPILAAVPEGDARDFVAASGLSDICRPDDVARMVRILRSRYQAFRSRAPQPESDGAFLSRFERAHLTEQLAENFRLVLGCRQPSA